MFFLENNISMIFIHLFYIHHIGDLWFRIFRHAPHKKRSFGDLYNMYISVMGHHVPGNSDVYMVYTIIFGTKCSDYGSNELNN